MEELRYIDLFAGMGGTRIGFEQACADAGVRSRCVFTSEIKQTAIAVYKHNFPGAEVFGDIAAMPTENIPDFDFLLAGFPCQPFSYAGSRHGFSDKRGILFFEIERILRAKKPAGFLLENVEGLVSHDGGRTLGAILSILTDIGYKVSYRVLNASDYGVPQARKRIYIIGSLAKLIPLDFFRPKYACLGDILEQGKPLLSTGFVRKLLSQFSVSELSGKSIKDKRGGGANIHSWDIGLKGEVSQEQKQLLSKLLRQRRQKRWAEAKGITWMDGMPLTLSEIGTFHSSPNLEEILDDLVFKGYLRFEYPKDIKEEVSPAGYIRRKRVYATDKEKGYNIVSGKLSFEISKILDPLDIAPTLVATDVTRLAVPDGEGIRRLTLREGLRLSGFPEWYEFAHICYEEAFDLLGNTVIVPVVKMLCERYISEFFPRSFLVA